MNLTFNPVILTTEIQSFIQEHLNDNITGLLFKKNPFDTVSMPEIVSQIEAKQKCKIKLPTWFETDNIYFPNKLNIEQTSSEDTGQYKANLVNGQSLIDLTGGFGVDCYYFSKNLTQVTHCEINIELSKMVTHNYKSLDIQNINTIATNGIEYLKKNDEKYDWIYIDPSRRDDLKRKVFLISECTPNVVEHLDLLLTTAKNILIKVSPLLDLKKTISELKFVKSVYIVALKNDVKELLFVVEKGYVGDIKMHTVNLTKNGQQTFTFNFNNSELASYGLPEQFLYEPNSAILKAGAFQKIGNSFQLKKLHQHSHLYTNTERIDFPGRTFVIKEIIPFQKKDIKKRFGKKQYNITTRNFPNNVEHIRKTFNIKDGGKLYLFFTTNIFDVKIVILCEK